MLKLNASYSKKVPAEAEYSSKSYHAAVEVELPDGLTVDQLQERIHTTFELVRASVEAELDGSAGHQVAAKAAPPATRPFPAQAAPAKQPAPSAEPASNKQLRYLLDLGRKREMDVAALNALAYEQYGAEGIYALDRKQCSALLDLVRSQRKAA